MYPTYYKENPNCCCRFVCGFITGIIVVVAAALVVAYFVLKPKAPIIYVSSIKASGLNNGSSNVITASFDITFRVINADKKMTATFNDFRAAMLYKNYELGVGSRGMRLVELKGETDNVVTNVRVNRVILKEPMVVQPNGNVAFGATVMSRVEFKGGFKKPRTYQLEGHCDGLEVGVASGFMVGAEKRCIIVV